MKESLWIQLSLLYAMHIFVFFSMQPLVESWLQTQPPPEKLHPIDYPLDLSVSSPKKCCQVECASTDSDSMANDDNQCARSFFYYGSQLGGGSFFLFLSVLNFWGMFVRVYPKIVQGLTFLNSVKHITTILARCTS